MFIGYPTHGKLIMQSAEKFISSIIIKPSSVSCMKKISEGIASWSERGVEI